MFQLPKSTLVNRKIPKVKFYEKLQANNNLKDLFVQQIESVVWKYKLSKDTIRLEPKDDIEEIQVFEIHLKEQSYSVDLLRAIDRAIPYPILFVLRFDNQAKLAIAYKDRNQVDHNRSVIHSYYDSNWQHAAELQLDIIRGFDLKMVYENIIRSLLPTQISSEIELAVALEQQSYIEKLSQQCKRLEAKIQQEKQFNRKVELNIQLQKMRKQLAELLPL